MAVWLIKEVFYQRKRHYLTITAICISIILVLLVNIISGYIIDNVNYSFEQLGLNINCIQLLKNRKDNWIDFIIEDCRIEKYSRYNKKQERDYKIIGCDSDLSQVFTFEFESGSFLNKTSNMYNDNQVVIGNKLKHYFKCYQIDESININGITFRVVGILKKESRNLYEEFDDCIFVFNDYVTDYNHCGLYFVSESRFDDRYLNEFLGKDNYLFVDQSQTKESLNSLLKLIRNVLMVLSFVSVGIAIISLVNNTLNNIYTRMKEIGIKKALGASSKDIYIQFILENMIIFLIGILISLIVVFSVVKVINISLKNKIAIDLSDNVKYIVLILTAGSICNIYPAKKASEITIIETIKNREFS